MAPPASRWWKDLTFNRAHERPLLDRRDVQGAAGCPSSSEASSNVCDVARLEVNCVKIATSFSISAPAKSSPTRGSSDYLRRSVEWRKRPNDQRLSLASSGSLDRRSSPTSAAKFFAILAFFPRLHTEIDDRRWPGGSFAELCLSAFGEHEYAGAVPRSPVLRAQMFIGILLTRETNLRKPRRCRMQRYLPNLHLPMRPRALRRKL